MKILFLLLLFSLKLSAASEVRHELLPFSGKEKVEIFWTVPFGKGPFPVYIYAHQFQGKMSAGAAPIAESGMLGGLARMGFVSVVFSQAGHGQSTGSPDNCGKLSQEGLKTVIRYMKSLPFVDQEKIVLHGLSMGANLSSLVAAQENNLAAIILESASYDFTGMMRRIWAQGFQKPYLKRFYQILTDHTGEAPKDHDSRSLYSVAAKIKAPVLILSGGGDSTSLPEESVRFFELLRKTSPGSRLVIYPFSRHGIEPVLKGPDVLSFLKDNVGVYRNFVMIN